MNESQAFSVLRSEPETDAQQIEEKAEQAVFEVKNFVLRSAPVPKLLSAKMKRLIQIDKAHDFLVDENGLANADERQFEKGLTLAETEFPDLEKAFGVLDLNNNQTLADLFTHYEAAMTREQFRFSRARSGRYAAVFLSRMIAVERAYQKVIMYFLEPVYESIKSFADEQVKLTDHTLSSDIHRCCRNLGWANNLITERPREVSGSDRDQALPATEYYRLAKMNKQLTD